MMSQRSNLALRLLSLGLGILVDVAGCIGAGALAGAQSTGGRIRGTVTDTSGAAVTGAKVTLHQRSDRRGRETDKRIERRICFSGSTGGTYDDGGRNRQGFKKY